MNYYKYNGLSDKKYVQKCIEAEEKLVRKLKETPKTSNVDYKCVRTSRSATSSS